MYHDLLFSYQDLKYKAFNDKLIPNLTNSIGVRVPVLKKISRDIYKEDYRKFLDNNQFTYFEDYLLQALLISLIKEPDLAFKYFKAFVPKINNWMVCDIFISNFKIIKQDDRYYEEALKLTKSEAEFEIRCGLIIFLNYYIKSEYLDKIIETIINIKNDCYYVMMARAWVLSMIYVHDSSRIDFIIDNNLLDKTCHNKTISKIIDSKQVSNDKKTALKKKRR